MSETQSKGQTAASGSPLLVTVAALVILLFGSTDALPVAGGNLNPVVNKKVPDYKHFDFLLIGDWGQDANYDNMTTVASVMDQWAADNNSDAVISLGDNFYSGGRYAYEGVKSDTDEKFTTLWKDIYNGTTLSTLPWWVVLGNHDWYKLESNYYELLFALNDSSVWSQPDYFYTRRMSLSNNGDTAYATFIFIETDLLNYGYTLPKKPDVTANFKNAQWTPDNLTIQKQLAWIDKQLEKANNDDFVFVIGHHPTFTCGDDVKKSANMTELYNLVNKWAPTAFINGHHHTMAYYYTNDNRTLQLQVGNGGNADSACAPLDLAAPGAEQANVFGFGHARVTHSHFKLDLVTDANVVFESLQVDRRTPVDAVADTTYLPSKGDPAISFKWRLTNPLPSTTSATTSSATHSTSSSSSSSTPLISTTSSSAATSTTAESSSSATSSSSLSSSSSEVSTTTTTETSASTSDLSSTAEPSSSPTTDSSSSSSPVDSSTSFATSTEPSTSSSSTSSSSSSTATPTTTAPAYFDFMVLGDWGNNANANDQTGVANVMNTWATTNKSSAIISLGDNFYLGGAYNYDGVESVDDPKFNAVWKNVYNGAALAGLPWWMILGNHDWYTTESNYYQLLFSTQNKDTWSQPDYFYTRRIELQDPTTGAPVHASFIFIESDLLQYGYTSTKNPNLGVNFANAGWSTSNKTIEKQLAWIDNALQQANQDEFVFVLSHFPVFTCGADVSKSVAMKPLADLITKWQPTAFINGHHHNFAYYTVGNTLQLQLGNGGNVDASCAPVDTTAVGGEMPNVYGFGHARLTTNQFSIDLVTESNTVFHTATMGKRSPVTGVTADTTYLTDPSDVAVSFKWRLK